MSSHEPASEEELRAAYEEEIKRIRVEQIVLEQIVSLINLGMRRTGLAPGTEDERDIGQVRIAIEAVRALTPLVEQVAPQQAGPIRDALSQLQLAFVRLGGAADPAAPGAAAPGAPTADAPPRGAAPGGPPPPGAPPGAAPGAAPDSPPAEPPAPAPGEPGPAQRSGRLWVPGQ
ncbi:MAG: hypothetical protein ABSH51_05010 [Solirubrobacteraceae bacterium]